MAIETTPTNNDIYKRWLLGHKVNEAWAKINSYEELNQIFFFFLDNDPYEVKIENPEMLIANPILDSPLPVFYIGPEPPG